MPKNRKPIHDPENDEFLYHVLSNLSTEQIRQLSSAELNLVNTEKNLRRFIAWGRMDKKLAVATKVGIQWALSYWKHPDSLNKAFETVYKQHVMKRLRSDHIENMRANGIFVTTSKEYMLSLGMLAQNCHSDVYFLNSNFSKIGASVRVVKKAKALNPEFEKERKDFYLLSKVALEVLKAENIVRYNGLELIDSVILYYLFPTPNNYTHIEAIERGLSYGYKPTTVATHCRILFEQGYIDKIPTESRKPQYTIAAKGVQFVGNILGRVADDATR